MKRPTARLRGRILAVVACVLTGLLGVTAAAGTTYAAPANPNPINWTVEKLFYDQYGNDIPLRTGQDDYTSPTGQVIDGFGRVHIQQHGVVPPTQDIQATIANPANCVAGADARIRCTNGETNLFVVYSPLADPRSGDSYPFGIITAYYILPCIAPAPATDVHPDCVPSVPALPTTLTYTGPTRGTNGSPLTLSASLVDDLGIPVQRKILDFRIGTGDAAQSCDGTTDTSGTARCTIGELRQPSGAVAVTVTFAGDDGFKPSSDTSSLTPASPTTVKYTGPAQAVNGRPLALSAALNDYAGSPVADRTLHFRIGTGDAAQSCDGTTDTSGTARCTIGELRQPPTSIPVTVTFAGDAGYEASSDSTTVAVKSPTTLKYTGPTRLANGTGVTLSGVLKDYLGAPVADRSVRFVLGEDATAQSCEGTTDAAGTARCTIGRADQPLNEAATVPLRAAFAGDANYLASSTSTTLLLEYYTGRAYGLSAQLDLPLLPPVALPAQPDTGQVRTASATTTATPCTAAVRAVVLTAEGLCPSVTTTLAPGTSTARTTVTTATIGLPGLPVIDVSGLTATASSTCARATGSTRLSLTIGGTAVTVPTAPNSEVSLPGGSRLVINEQQPVAGASEGITVNAVHLFVAGNLGDVVLGSVSSAVHNCAT
ncbi:choice-of-anchor P family protein [Streptomyces shenzhenensis]|uniref:choice-of-anchor P family protein n=1 Tax=Streptomyces shenzhenensis TaxID=943815 RepID=UPI001F44265C|nr:choice-of-anchor P family protein [Streptomyces shenzhenensis]